MSGLPRTARFVLLASLALNVILAVALLVAAPWADRRDANRGRHAPAFPALFDPRALKEALPPERLPALDAALQQHRERMRAQLGALFDARRAVRAAIVAEPFDRAALDAAFAGLRREETATATLAQSMLGDVLAQTTPPERERVAKLMDIRKGRRAGDRRRDEVTRPDAPPAESPPPPPQD